MRAPCVCAANSKATMCAHVCVCVSQERDMRLVLLQLALVRACVCVCVCHTQVYSQWMVTWLPYERLLHWLASTTHIHSWVSEQHVTHPTWPALPLYTHCPFGCYGVCMAA